MGKLEQVSKLSHYISTTIHLIYHPHNSDPLGKSYTMIGSSDIGTCLQENGDFDSDAGITPRAVSELFRLLNERQAQFAYEVEVQMFQLYRDGLDDLLADKKKSRKPEDDNAPLKIVLAEHSDTGIHRYTKVYTTSSYIRSFTTHIYIPPLIPRAINTYYTMHVLFYTSLCRSSASARC